MNSIFSDEEWKQDKNDPQRMYILAINHRPDRAISIELIFVDGYPISQPLTYNIRAPWLRGEERQELTNILEEIYLNNLGKPIVFLWADALRDFIDRAPEVSVKKTTATIEPIVEKRSNAVLPPIYSDEPFEDRKSIFQAHISPVNSREEVQLVIEKLKENKKIANATHNMYAYRIFDDQRHALLADCDDDGETGASSRMLHLMDIADVKNVLVVVSRWFGGILLHNDRFKHINNACRMILVNHGYIKKNSETTKSKSNK